MNKATQILDQKYQRELDGAFIEMSRKNLKLGIGVLNLIYISNTTCIQEHPDIDDDSY